MSKPHLPACSVSTFRLVALSSTTRRRLPASEGCTPRKSRRGACGRSARGATTVKPNVEPSPGPALATHIVPPISSARRLLIARPESGAAVFARGRAVGLGEAAEQPCDALGAEADAGVAHRESQLRARRRWGVRRRSRTTSPRLGELDRVGQQVQQHLAQPRDVAVERRQGPRPRTGRRGRGASRRHARRRGPAPTRCSRAGRKDGPRCPSGPPRSSRSRGCR